MRRFFLCVALPLLLTGCATKVQLTDTDPDFAAELAGQPAVALAGVVVAATTSGELSADDAVVADETMYSAFLSQRPDLTVWPRPAVDGRLEPGALDSLRAEYAQLGRLRPDQVRSLAPFLADSRFLALARITGDQVRTVTTTDQDRGGLRPGAEGVPERDEDGWSRPVRTERRLELTVQIFDLRDGRMVWDAEASSRERQQYAYEDALGEDATYVRDRLAEDSDEPNLSRDGVYLQTPDLMVLLERALTKVVQKLPAAGR